MHVLSHVCMYTLANGSSAALQMGGGSSPPCPALTSQAPAGSAAPCCGGCGALEGTLAPGPPAPTPLPHCPPAGPLLTRAPNVSAAQSPPGPPGCELSHPITPRTQPMRARSRPLSSFLLLLKPPHPRVFFPLIFIFISLERAGGGERKKERGTSLRERHIGWLLPACAPH